MDQIYTSMWLDDDVSLSTCAASDAGLCKKAGANAVVPYRNHKLTQLMQDSLGGTAKTLMFVNCSPAASNIDETVTALKWAKRAKGIVNKR